MQFKPIACEKHCWQQDLSVQRRIFTETMENNSSSEAENIWVGQENSQLRTRTNSSFQRSVATGIRMQPDSDISGSHPLLWPVSMSAPNTTGPYVPAKFPDRNLVSYVFYSSTRATYSAHLTILEHITLSLLILNENCVFIICKQYKGLWNKRVSMPKTTEVL